MYDVTYSIYVTSYPLYLRHHIHYIWQHNTVCCLYHPRHICDFPCTTDDITSTLSQQTTVFMMSRPLQAWHHTHCIRHHTHCIFVITKSPLISYPLFFFIEFCHSLEWNSHGFTCVPNTDPPSHLPLHPIPLGLPSAPGLSACLMHPTWAGDLFLPRYYTGFDAVLLKHPTLSFSHRV